MTPLNGVLNVCVRRRQLASLCVFPHWGDTESTLALTDGRCDGMRVLVPPAACPLLETLRERDLPFVFVNGADPSDRAAGVNIDNVAAFRALTQYLLTLGHQRIAFYSRDFDASYSFLHERQEGYRQAMAEAGRLENIQFLTEHDEAALNPSSRSTAVMCVFDNLALGLMERLRQRGGRVPEDISIVGFDDIPLAASASPPLTTVRQPVTQIGERAAELLLTLIDGTDMDGTKAIRQECLPVEIIPRQSTAPPRI